MGARRLEPVLVRAIEILSGHVNRDVAGTKKRAVSRVDPVSTHVDLVNGCLGGSRPTAGVSAQGNCAPSFKIIDGDGGLLDTRSQVAQKSPISQQLSWPRTL